MAEPIPPATVECPTCHGRPKRPEHRVEGGSLSCRYCNRTFTFNMMRDGGSFTCSCEGARREACPTCFGDGVVTPEPPAEPIPDTPSTVPDLSTPVGWLHAYMLDMDPHVTAAGLIAHLETKFNISPKDLEMPDELPDPPADIPLATPADYRRLVPSDPDGRFTVSEGIAADIIRRAGLKPLTDA